jgi:hypothetical protein
MGKVTEKLKEEFLAMIPPTIFFFVAFHVVALVRSLMIKATGISPLASFSIAIAALVLGKSVLIADLLPWINRFPEKPLIYNVAWKTAIYTLVALAIHYLEHLWDYSREAGGIKAGNRELFAKIIWPHFWAVQIILFVLIVMYCTTHELVRTIGRDKVIRIFFGPMPAPEV